VVVPPSLGLAVQTGEAARAICSRLGLTVSVQVGCLVCCCRPLGSWLCRPVTRPGHLLQAGTHSLRTGGLYGVVVSPSCELAVQTGEATRPSAPGWGSQSLYRWVVWCGGVALL
jgi:hypothetical protein